MTFSFDGSKPAGDVVTFFESLQIDPQLRWNIFVSSEYLTLAFLVGDPKYARYESSIDSAFRGEVTDSGCVGAQTENGPQFAVAGHPDIKDVKDFVQALSQGNPQCAGTDGQSALDRIIFGYGWTAERSHFYNAVADITGADVMLAPLRDAFCESCLRIDYPAQAIGLVNTLKKSAQESLASILEPSGGVKFAMRLPFFTAYTISKTDNPSQCIDLALSMRNAPEFQNCRTIFHNLDHLSAADKRQELNGILKYLNQSCDSLMKKYAISTKNGVPFSLSLGFSGITFGIDLKLDSLFRSHKNKAFSRVFRNIAQDMLNVERLGGLHEKVCSSVREHKDANYPKIAVTPRYMEDRESPFGRPASL